MGLAASISTYMESAVAAQLGGDHASAISYARAALGRMGAAPNANRNAPGGGSEALAWNSAGIVAFIAECRRAMTAASHATSGPFQLIPITYAREGDAADYS